MVTSKEPKVISRTSDVESEYKWGFVTDIEEDIAPKGLNEDIVRLISEKKGEPEWMTDWRLRSYRHWLTLENEEPTLGEGPLPEDRLPGRLLLRRAEAEGRRTEVAG